MGLGSKEQRRKTYYCSPRARKDKKLDPHFKVTMYDTDGSKHELPDETAISGYLVGLGVGEFEWPKDSGKKLKTIKIFLMDADELFQIEANRDNNLIRSLMNSIIGTRDFGVMRIALKAKNENAQVYVMNDGNKTTWKFRWEEDVKPLLYQVEDPKEEGKMITVYKKYDQLLWDEWEKLIPYVNERAQKLGYTLAPTTASDPAASQPANNPAQSGQSLQEEFDNQPTPNIAGGPPIDNYEPVPDSEMPF